MSRVWAPPDVITYNIPASGAGPINFAFGTILALVKNSDNGTWSSYVEMEDSGASQERAGLIRDNGGALCWIGSASLLRSTDAGTGTSFTCTTSDGWCLYFGRKATGTAAPTLGKFPVGGSLTTRTITATTGNRSGSLASGFLRIGGDDDPSSMKGAVFAVLPGVVLDDTAIGTIMAALTTASIISVAGADGWVVDYLDDFVNNLVANNTNQTSDSGTADDGADDPAGWTYGAAGAGDALEHEEDDSIQGTDEITLEGEFSLEHEIDDSIQGTDARAQTVGLAKADTAQVTDTGFSQNPASSQADDAVLTDNISTSLSGDLEHAVDDTTQVTDAHAAAINVNVADTADLADTPAKQPALARADALTGTDTSAQAWSINRTIADPVVIRDHIDSGAQRFRTGTVTTGGQLVNPRGVTGGNGPAHHTGGSALLSLTGGTIVELVPA